MSAAKTKTTGFEKLNLASIKEAAGKSEAPQARPVGAVSQAAAPGRRGKVNVTGYFHPDVKRSLMMIRLKPEKQGLRDQDLLAEALNDLFAKYNVPQTAYTKAEE